MFVPGRVSPNEDLPLSKDRSPNLRSISFPAAGTGYWHLLTLAYLTWTIWTYPCPGHEVSHRHLADISRARQGVGKHVGVCPIGWCSTEASLAEFRCSSQRPTSSDKFLHIHLFILFWDWIEYQHMFLCSKVFSYVVRLCSPTLQKPGMTPSDITNPLHEAHL